MIINEFVSVVFVVTFCAVLAALFVYELLAFLFVTLLAMVRGVLERRRPQPEQPDMLEIMERRMALKLAFRNAIKEIRSP